LFRKKQLHSIHHPADQPGSAPWIKIHGFSFTKPALRVVGFEYRSQNTLAMLRAKNALDGTVGIVSKKQLHSILVVHQTREAGYWFRNIARRIRSRCCVA
jgi:hypothetical protein